MSQWYTFAHYTAGKVYSSKGDINVDLPAGTPPACPTNDQCLNGACVGVPVFWCN
jgi:hypothetical protein